MPAKVEGFQGEFRFLSNFYPCEVEFEGLTYQSSEAAFQAQKTLEEELRTRFTRLNAREARILGRDKKKIKIRVDWENVRLNVMYRILREKFSKQPCRNMLLETGDAYLEETNWWYDSFWGVYNGVGKNHLGRLLMLVRDEIREGLI